MISFRFLLFIFFFTLSQLVFGEASLHYRYGVRYPDGNSGSAKLVTDDFTSFLSLEYANDDVNVNGFFFRSDVLQLGPVAHKGILSELNGDRKSFHFPGEYNGLAIYSEGNPRTNMGVIFSPFETDMGFSVLRKEDFTNCLFWFEPDFLTHGSMFMAQSLTTVEDNSPAERWYLDEPPIFSSIMFHSLFSLVLGSEALYGGGRMILNWARYDRGGMSFLLRTGGSISSVLLQSELSWSSPYYYSADLDYAEYPLIWKSRIVLETLPFLLESRFKYKMEKAGLPWDHRGIVLENVNSLLHESNAWDLEGKIFWKTSKAGLSDWIPDIGADMSYRGRRSFWFWEGGLSGEYRSEIYYYILSLSGGVNRDPVQTEILLSLEIDKRILLRSGFKIQYESDPICLRAEIDLEDIGIYNYSDIEFKPSFAVYVTVSQKIQH